LLEGLGETLPKPPRSLGCIFYSMFVLIDDLTLIPLRQYFLSGSRGFRAFVSANVRRTDPRAPLATFEDFYTLYVLFCTQNEINPLSTDKATINY